MAHKQDTQYVPAMVPLDDKNLAQYIRSELEKISEAFGKVEDIQLVELHVAPERPREGMIVMADGTDWDPGSGQGMYGRINGA